MFIGWLRGDNLKQDIDAFEQEKVIDKNLVLKSYEENPAYCFGIYEGEKLMALITAYAFDESILINNFYALERVESSLKKRLFKLLLNNIDREKTLLILAQHKESLWLKEFGFLHYHAFSQAIFHGGGVAFNFSNATAKSIAQENYQKSLKRYDYKAFKEDRFNYVTTAVMKQSSLILSNDFGYQHSYALNRSLVKISPWIMESDALSDAEKFIRGVIYHRGLKKIITFIPQVKEITDLYESYRFELIGGYHLLYLGNKPTIDLEMIYGL
ncbi:MAG TPA: hypothetical protein ENK82_05535 [Campylobacterales bacterium]|nr:hypothetical protein [Campylobacterales bacterium]